MSLDGKWLATCVENAKVTMHPLQPKGFIRVGVINDAAPVWLHHFETTGDLKIFFHRCSRV